jgi:hypothetical protein
MSASDPNNRPPILSGQKRNADELSPSSSSSASSINPRDLPRITHRHHARFKPDSFNELPNLPPPPFNILKALIRHQNLFFQFAYRLDAATLTDLYAIDKEFHYRFNKYCLGLTYEHAKYWAPIASHIFTPGFFPHLCIADPMRRPMRRRPHLARDVPSLRWAKLVIFRSNVVREILTLLAIEGLRVPKEAEGVMHKLWMLMEQRNENTRYIYLNDRSIWRDEDLWLANLLMVKLDMRFGDPVSGKGICELSGMLLAHKSMTTLLRVLRGWLLTRPGQDYDQLRAMLKRTFFDDDLLVDEAPWLDDEEDSRNVVREEEWGILHSENWSWEGPFMADAPALLVEECMKRRLPIQKHYLDFVLYGFLDEETGDDLPRVRWWRGADQGMQKKVVEEEIWNRQYKDFAKGADDVWGWNEQKTKKDAAAETLVHSVDWRWQVSQTDEEENEEEAAANESHEEILSLEGLEEDEDVSMGEA